jgi:hypothetical protein
MKAYQSCVEVHLRESRDERPMGGSHDELKHTSASGFEMMLTVNHSTKQKKHSSAMELSAVF